VPRVLLKVLYWAAVLAVSIALVIVLISFFESRDKSAVDDSSAPSAVSFA
jgi:hypothetical protein